MTRSVVADPTDRSTPGRSLIGRVGVVLGALAAIVGVEAAVLAFIDSKGVAVTGDEPHYMVVARALAHWTVHPYRAYLADLRSHQFYDWPKGTAPSNLNFHLYAGSHGTVSTHGLGVSALLVPFVWTGKTGSLLGFVAIETAVFLYVFFRAADLAGLSRSARVTFAVVVAGPAVLMAATQVYPDLLTGLLVACALVEVVAVESGRRLEWWRVAVVACSMAMLPWLHPKDLAPAVIVLATFAFVAIRGRQRQALVAVIALTAVSWLAGLAYNLYYFGHLLGYPQPFPSLNRVGVELMEGLLVDRHQGLFVQVPTAVFGLVGLWLARRRVPVAVAATLLSAASLVYLNGTYTGVPYGGTVLAGRFQWSTLVPILAWSPMAIAGLQHMGRRLRALTAGIAALWVLEWIPILRGDHLYYNQVIGPGPVDVSHYSGWWSRLDVLLPVFVPGHRLIGWPSYGLPVAAALMVVAVVGIFALVRFDRRKLVIAGALSLVAVAVVVAAALLVHRSSPSRPASQAGAGDQPAAGAYAGSLSNSR